MRRLPIYSKAGGPNAQPEVRAAVDRYSNMSVEAADKANTPLLYWLLGSGTPAYKMPKEWALYGPPPARLAQQRCSNCASAYKQVTSGRYICSQVTGEIDPQAWCRVWNRDRN